MQTIDISGTTRIFPVIGWPVEQVKAPALFNAYFQRHSIDARVIPLKISPEKYCEAVRMLMQVPNVGGIFVSIPHKPLTLQAVDEATPRALLAGACNAVYRRDDQKIIGDLIDGEGFMRALDRVCGETPFDGQASKALVVGCGGVGRAIAAALMSRGLKHLGLFDTQLGLVDDLKNRLSKAFPDATVTYHAPDASGFDLVVNASPIGMHPDHPMPIALNDVKSSCIVADCGMKIEMTKLLIEAQRCGCRIQKGKEMLIEQAPLYMDMFGYSGATAEEFRELAAL